MFSRLFCYPRDKEYSIQQIINWNDTIPFVPPIENGRVIKVHDGDTITIASYLPYKESTSLYRFSIRMKGIYTTEVKSKDESEKFAAYVSKQALENLILHKIVTLKNIETEKYGRILADVYLDYLNLNIWMLNNHYAIPYDGIRKKRPKSWLNYQRTGEINDIEYTIKLI